MRCHYMSDLHLEAQDFRQKLSGGDVLIIAGDLCHASALDPARTDPCRQNQRDRVRGLVDDAMSAFGHVLVVPGNHEHYDGIFEETVPLLRRHLDGVTILDNEAIDIAGVKFFGTTLWSDFENRNDVAMEKARRGMGEYFFTKTRGSDPGGQTALARLRPADTLAAHDQAIATIRHQSSVALGPMVIVSHHAPSQQGLNPLHKGNGLDGAFASDLEDFIGELADVPIWVHGHTHIRKRYRIGNTTLLANCRGFDGKDLSARKFSPDCYFDL